MVSKTTISILNDLIEVSKDGEQGFLKAAEDVKATQLKSVFLACAEDISHSVAELQSAVTSLGGTPETGGSMAGALHRGWLDVRAAVVDRTDLAILEEAEHGEDVAKRRYLDALNKDGVDITVRQMIEKQYEGVLRNHGIVKDLRDQYRAAA